MAVHQLYTEPRNRTTNKPLSTRKRKERGRGRRKGEEHKEKIRLSFSSKTLSNVENAMLSFEAALLSRDLIADAKNPNGSAIRKSSLLAFTSHLTNVLSALSSNIDADIGSSIAENIFSNSMCLDVDDQYRSQWMNAYRAGVLALRRDGDEVTLHHIRRKQEKQRFLDYLETTKSMRKKDKENAVDKTPNSTPTRRSKRVRTTSPEKSSSFSSSSFSSSSSSSSSSFTTSSSPSPFSNYPMNVPRVQSISGNLSTILTDEGDFETPISPLIRFYQRERSLREARCLAADSLTKRRCVQCTTKNVDEKRNPSRLTDGKQKHSVLSAKALLALQQSLASARDVVPFSYARNPCFVEEEEGKEKEKFLVGEGEGKEKEKEEFSPEKKSKGVVCLWERDEELIKHTVSQHSNYTDCGAILDELKQRRNTTAPNSSTSLESSSSSSVGIETDNRDAIVRRVVMGMEANAGMSCTLYCSHSTNISKTSLLARTNPIILQSSQMIFFPSNQSHCTK